MTAPRALLGVLLALGLLAGTGHGWAQYPEPRVREQPDPFDAATRLFEAGRWDDAADAFDSAAREGAVVAPPEALRRWGLAASEAGRPLAAYVRLRQYLAVSKEPADREALAERIARARDALVAGAAHFSRVLASVERRPEGDSGGERLIVRAAAREGDVSIEGLAGFRVESPLWRRAEEIALAPYLDLIRRVLDTPAFIEDVPAQTFDPNDPGPRRAAVLRLVVGDEERRLEALRGDPYDRLREVVDVVVDFARRAPPAGARAPDALRPRPGKKR